MSTTSRLLSTSLGTLVLAALLPAPCLAEPAELPRLPAEQARGATREDDLAGKAASAGGYRKRWALIIGIDYNHGNIRPLNNAEKDAKDVYNLLASHYGYMQRDFALRRPREQSPDLRSLTRDDGEFRLAPAEGADFSRYVVKDIDVHMLRAMVLGEYGNWWFDETPFFIPSLRKAILVHAPLRRGLYADAMSRRELLAATEEVIKGLEEGKTPDDLTRLRLHEARALLRPDPSVDFKQLRQDLIGELQGRKDLEATELHLLAVLQHSLGMKEAAGSYERALEKYQAERGRRSLPEPQGTAAPLEALCNVDFGYNRFLLNENERAVEAYGVARTLCGSDGAARPFEALVLCREADAWQRLGRWGMSKDRLDLALHVAKEMDPKETSSLTAHTLSRRGWALMEQWKFADAVKDFENSNDILRPFLAAGDPNARLLESDNRQGAAIAHRCQGDARRAAAEFRAITVGLASRFQELREGVNGDPLAAEIKPRLIERWVGSVQRLVDCNLFADPQDRDLAEATDDMRRVIRACFMMPANQGAVAEAALLYKQAIVLSLRSSVQDLSLAASYCKKAEAAAASLDGAQAGLVEIQGKLAPPIVELYRVCADKPAGLQDRRDALAKLRRAIEELREKWKNDDSRETLEFLMFANRILLDEGIDADRYETLMDAEMLLGLCRRALLGGTGESLRYLRPYYDAVMEAKLRLQPKHAKELLEVQWEATQGTIFKKSPEAIPVMALYVLKTKPYLLVDVPGGASTYYCLDDDYSLREIRQALLAGGGPLELPREVVRQLDLFPSQAPEDRVVRCLWEDPVRLEIHTAAFGGPSPAETQGRPRALFKLPQGFRMAGAAAPASGDQAGPGKGS